MAAAQSSIASASSGAVADRAPTLFGIVLICVGLIAAYALATGRLQAVWASLLGQTTAAGTGGSVLSPQPAAGAVPIAAPGTNSSLNGLGGLSGLLPSFNQEYTTPNIAQPQVPSAATPIAAPSPSPYATSYEPYYNPYTSYGGAPSVSTPYSVYGAYA